MVKTGGDAMMIIYADFGCPACYLASRRTDLLRAAGETVDWRAVETQPALPVTGRRLAPDEQDARIAAFAELAGSLLPGEALPGTVPAFRPKTEAAVTAYAEAYPIGVADDVRQLLMSLYWVDGADIGSPTVLRTPLAGPVLRGTSHVEALRESGFAVGADRGPISTEAWRRIRDWRAEWQRLGDPALPALVVDGIPLTGSAALKQLAQRLEELGVPPDAYARDPRRYPAIATRPDAHWVSWYGGRWRNAYRLPAPKRAGAA
jgi:predicted DsbA family dithiol-disulfide isomerase